MAGTVDERFMRRALQLAACGAGHVSPNPMVGAVIVADGRIIGEGYHRRYGAPHAEVNAVGSVKDCDRPLLRKATMYVTLEPCSHYGKTPPCADLIIREGIPRIVIGSRDPFPQVSGKGIDKLRAAGCDVSVGLLREECEWLNRRFMTAHRLHRPFIELKWAQTADGFIALCGDAGVFSPMQISDSLTAVWMHRDRSMADAVMAGTNTVLVDNPRLTLRLFPGRDPLRVIPDRNGRIPQEYNIFADSNVLIIRNGESLHETMRTLYEDNGVTSIIVEGGAALLKSFLEAGLWDEVRIETSPFCAGAGLEAPAVPKNSIPAEDIMVRGHRIVRFVRSNKQTLL